MWKAIENTIPLVKEEGIYWISIYQKGPGFSKDLKLKIKYNSSSSTGKKLMVYKNIFKLMIRRLISAKNPFTWNQKTSRGMNTYHDLVDWLGGLPYEVANKEEINTYCTANNLKLEKAEIAPEGGCSIYLFNKISSP